IAFRDERKDCWGQRHQTRVRMGSHSVVESRAARRNQRTFCGYKREARAVCALDGGSVYGCDGTGPKQPAGIRSVGRRPAHEAGDRKSAAELHGEISAVLRALQFAQLFSTLDRGSGPYILPLWKVAVWSGEPRDTWSRFLRASGGKLPGDSAYAEFERLDRRAAAAVRVDHFGNECCAF